MSSALSMPDIHLYDYFTFHPRDLAHPMQLLWLLSRIFLSFPLLSIRRNFCINFSDVLSPPPSGRVPTSISIYFYLLLLIYLFEILSHLEILGIARARPAPPPSSFICFVF